MEDSRRNYRGSPEDQDLLGNRSVNKSEISNVNTVSQTWDSTGMKNFNKVKKSIRAVNSDRRQNSTWVDFSTKSRNSSGIQNSKGLEHPNNAKNSYGHKNCIVGLF